MNDCLHIAVIGSGGREHAVIKKLLQSRRAGKITAIPGNGGIAREVPCVNIRPTDIAAVVRWCVDNSIDYVVVTPDDPLALGMVDALAEKNIPAFGPVKAAAKIESSKAYAKNLMKKYHIPTAAFEVFNSPAEALCYAKWWFERNVNSPLVVKADGLALGKGVTVCERLTQAESAIRGCMEDGKFGESGKTVVIEECLTGPEVSVLAFCDGTTIVPMTSSMDHKRAEDGGLGENTGGMGTIAPNPFYTAGTAAVCMETIYLPTVRMMAEEGAPFKGCLYFGLMLTADGPKVIEYNCRFGDPETQAVLPLLQSDLLELMLACTEGRLDLEQAVFSGDAACCIILASGGYPLTYKTGFPITGLAEAEKIARIYYAGVAASGSELLTAGGRVLGVGATDPSLEAALADAYTAAAKIAWPGLHYRHDIGISAVTSA
ncbi:MAG: phosphoribosylamine--glycine ligase [Spirochaetaceae bacterium]|jgi:phosphoribosylamine--glycine ligase|nr:phosphoribosylamine--glycine ligase [Spirochaetaceae bacterium]